MHVIFFKIEQILRNQLILAENHLFLFEFGASRF